MILFGVNGFYDKLGNSLEVLLFAFGKVEKGVYDARERYNLVFLCPNYLYVT